MRRPVEPSRATRGPQKRWGAARGEITRIAASLGLSFPAVYTRLRDRSLVIDADGRIAPAAARTDAMVSAAVADLGLLTASADDANDAAVP